MLILDSNNIVSIGDLTATQHASHGKQFTRNFHGYPISAFDHTVLVYTKKGILERQWKDIGSGESIIAQRSQCILQDKPHPGHARLGYDILYKVDETTGGIKNIARVDSQVLSVAQHFFGTSMTALAAPSYESSMTSETIASFLFGIALAHGKWPVKEGILSPVKVTIPLTSSLFGKKDMTDVLAKNLHDMGFVHTLQYVQSASYEIAQLVIHDVALLQQFVTWMKPVVNIDKISTYEKRQKVYDALCVYVKEKGFALPIASLSELVILECD